MTYQVTITYQDEKSVNILAPVDEIVDLEKRLEKREDISLFNKKTHVGFWCPLHLVRHIIISPYIAQQIEPKELEAPKAEEVEKEEAKPE